MKKSLNESLREEFSAILKEPAYLKAIAAKKLDESIIKGAFEKLLSGDGFLEANPDDVEKTRSEFENYIINTLKTRRH